MHCVTVVQESLYLRGQHERVRETDGQTDRERRQGLGSGGSSAPAWGNPYRPQVQCNARIQGSNPRFLISLPRLFQPACPVYSRTK